MQLWSLYALFIKLPDSCIISHKRVNKQLCKVFYFIPPENILFNEGCCAQPLCGAEDADTAALLNGH